MITKNLNHLWLPGLPQMQHQRDDFVRSRDLAYFGILNEMGTGKSLTLIDTITWLYMNQQIDGAIIVSDKGAYLNWLVELKKCLIVNEAYIKVRTTVYSSAKPCEIPQGADDILDILIMNVEAFSGEKASIAANKFIDSHYTLICVDEATSIKGHKSARTKSLTKIARRCDCRRIMTGTPITRSPLDLFSMCEFLQPGILGHRSFVGFRTEYAVMQRMSFGSRSFDTIVGYRNLDKLSRKLESFTCRRTKAECLDLPDKVYEVVRVEHTDYQAQYYRMIREEAMIQFNQGLLTTTSAITAIQKLHQINCGHVSLDDGTVLLIPSNRVKILVELIEKIEGKVLIWCAFQRDVELILDALKEVKLGYPVHYYGRTTEAERKRALELFSSDPRCLWFVGTAATGGKGLTLTQANYSIYYSNSDSGEDRWQSEDRNHRKGQTNKVTYIDLVVPNTVDEKKLKQLKQKKDLAHQVLDSLREMFTLE